MLATNSTRLAQTVARRHMSTASSMDWSKPIFKSDSEMTAKINQFRAWIASADSMAEKYSGPPSPIDFAAAKAKVKATDLVENLEKFYSTASPPAETYVWSEEDKAEKSALIEAAKLDRAKAMEDVAYYKERVAILKSNRTTRDTTAAQMREIYPEIAAAIDKEIDNREWFKDVVDACKSIPDTTKYRNFLKERYPEQADEIDKRFDLAFPAK